MDRTKKQEDIDLQKEKAVEVINQFLSSNAGSSDEQINYQANSTGHLLKNRQKYLYQK